MAGDPDKSGLSGAEVGELLGQQLDLLRGFVRRRSGHVLRSREAVSDLVQSTLREVIQDGEGLVFSDPDALRGHVYRVAARKIVSKGRYHSALQRDPLRQDGFDSDCEMPSAAESASASPSRAAVRREELERLAAAIDDLDPRDREVLVLRKLLGVTATQVASELGIAESTVRWRLSVALTELAARLGA